MTEQMAIEHIGNLAGDYKCWDDRISREESLILCKLLDELEQYRALGTAEEILKVLDNHKKVVAMQHETLKEYRKLGTVEELTEAKELYDVINKTEDDLCLLGMASKTEAREHIKAMARQLKGKV